MKLGSFHVLLVAAALAFLWAGAGSISSARADDDASRKYPLLAAYIYNFTQFTTWPANAVGDEFKVCIVGKSPFGASLDPMKSRTVQGKKIAVHHFGGGEGEIAACNIVFVSPSASGDAKSIVARLKAAPVLTMSESGGFSDAGGMVEFTPADGKIGIAISLPAVRAAGLSISSKLLSLANVKG